MSKINKKLIVANWKMHKTISIAKQFTDKFLATSKELLAQNKHDVVICPAFHLLDSVRKSFIGSSIYLGAQDCCSFSSDEGAFTGDVSAWMLRDIGCEYVIIGHSERRERYKEINDVIKNKILNAQQAGLKVILCIGETLEQREDGAYKEALSSMLEASLPKNILLDDLIVAYEPIWAIGTGRTANLEQIEEIHKFLSEICLTRFAKELKIIYGGSVNTDNASKILNINKVSGLLVGGASLDPEKFYNLIKIV